MTYADDPNPNILERLRRRLSPIVDRLNIDPKWVVPLMCACIGFKCTEHAKWGGFVIFGHSDKDRSLYHNGMLFLRLMLPFWIGIGARWRGRGIGKEFFQCGFGWKRNGQFGVNWRVQSDESAARGTTGPNFGQATGWWEGAK